MLPVSSDFLKKNKKQTGHPRPWHWREIPAHSTKLWSRHWNGFPNLHEAETRSPHWPGLAPSGGPDHVGSTAVQQDPGSHGSLSTGNVEYTVCLSTVKLHSCTIEVVTAFVLLLLFYSRIHVSVFLFLQKNTILSYSLYSIQGFFPHQRLRGSSGTTTG